MAVNWFEGGRRIVSLLAGLVLLGGTGYLFFGDTDNRVVLESSSPEERLHWTLNRCDYPAFDKEWEGKSTFMNGEARQMVACFRPKVDGKIVIGYGPEQSIPLSPARPGQPSPPSMKVRKIFDADPFSTELEPYALQRMRQFNLTYEEMRVIGSGLWKIGVVRFCERAIEAFPWIAGLVVGLWVIAAGIGWLLRGFAGVPTGHDFKVDDLNKAARSNRASLDWLWMGIGAWGFVASISWLTTKIMTPAPTAVDRFVGEAFGGLGTIIVAVIGLAIAAGGAVALRTLFYQLLRREQPELKDDAETRALLLFGIANIAILMAASWLVTTYTFVGPWVNALDHWSRSNGFKDGGTVGLFVLCLLWPLIPLWALNQAARPDEEAPQR